MTTPILRDGWLPRILVVTVGLATLSPWISVAVALVFGIALSLTIGNPWPAETRAYTPRLLQASVVGLGFGADLAVVARVGLHGLGYTALGIAFALGFGTWFARRLGVLGDTGLLVAVGTSICGGSAIAAVAPAIRAKSDEVSMALVVVFLLNGIALFIFPFVGHACHLGQDAFGLWCALAIHDTSSVVGAATSYGDRALEIATAAKLARALWIVPVTIGVAMMRRDSATAGGPARPPAKRPWFIAGFVLAAALVTFVPAFRPTGLIAADGARHLLKLTLFLTGLGLTREAIKKIGTRPLILATTLWAMLASATLAGVMVGWIS